MLRGIYMSGTGMLTLDRQMNTLSNNITNADTVGYREDLYISRSFKDVLITRLHDPSVIQRREVGPLNHGVHVDELITQYRQGGFEATDRPTDFALVGENGFFAVETPDGERYTRTGTFSLTADCDLITSEGYYVLNADGEHINVGEGDFAVREDGTIYVAGENAGKMKIVSFENPADLRKQGSNLFYNYNDQEIVDAQAQVKQGFTEMSNVDMGRAMVDMITIQRAYETNQKLIQMADGTLDQAVNRVGRV